MSFECWMPQSATPCSRCRALPRAQSKFRFPNYRDSPRYNNSLSTNMTQFLAQFIKNITQTNPQTLSTCKTTQTSTQTKVMTIHSNHQLLTLSPNLPTSTIPPCAVRSSILDDPRLCMTRIDVFRVLVASDSPFITANPLLARHIHASFTRQITRSTRD